MELILERKRDPQSPKQHQSSVSLSKMRVVSTSKCDSFTLLANNKSVSSFFAVIYLTSSTAAAARKQKHKSLSSDNVFSALEDIEFENFIEPLREALEGFRKANKEKKTNKANESNAGETLPMNTNDDDMNGDVQEPTDGTEIEE